MAKVRNSESPTSTWFGGVCAVPRACLVIDKIIEIRGKQVTAMRTEGRKTIAVMIVDIFKAAKISDLPNSVELPVLKDTTGAVGSVAASNRLGARIIKSGRR